MICVTVLKKWKTFPKLTQQNIKSIKKISIKFKISFYLKLALHSIHHNKYIAEMYRAREEV